MRTITGRQAQEALGIPRGSLRAWETLGRLVPAEITADGTHTYRLAHVIDLWHGTRRRTRHARRRRSAALTAS